MHVSGDSDAQVLVSYRAQLLSQQRGTCTHCGLYFNLKSLWCLHVLLGMVTPFCHAEEAGVDPS